MSAHESTRGGATATRAGGIGPAQVTEMIGVKWSPTRHGDLRRRLKIAVAEDGADGYADWLLRQLDARDAAIRRRLAKAPHPLAAVG